MKKDLEKKAKDAKDDQQALRAVLSDAVSAVQVMSLKVDALQAQVTELGLKFKSHSEEMVALIRSGDEATKRPNRRTTALKRCSLKRSGKPLRCLMPRCGKSCLVIAASSCGCWVTSTATRTRYNRMPF